MPAGAMPVWTLLRRLWELRGVLLLTVVVCRLPTPAHVERIMPYLCPLCDWAECMQRPRVDVGGEAAVAASMAITAAAACLRMYACTGDCSELRWLQTLWVSCCYMFKADVVSSNGSFDTVAGSEGVCECWQLRLYAMLCVAPMNLAANYSPAST